MEELLCVDWFPAYGYYMGIVGSQGNKGVQEGYGTIVFGIFCGKLDVGV